MIRLATFILSLIFIAPPLSYGQIPLGSIRGTIVSESTEEPVGTDESAIGILPSIGVSAQF
jgi:hypothetical protein